jgi:hypothetical protein
MPKQICRGRDFWAPLVKEFEEAHTEAIREVLQQAGHG